MCLLVNLTYGPSTPGGLSVSLTMVGCMALPQKWFAVTKSSEEPSKRWEVQGEDCWEMLVSSSELFLGPCQFL